jgi:manganese/zinc/iron transport system substrate-binding protein
VFLLKIKGQMRLFYRVFFGNIQAGAVFFALLSIVSTACSTAGRQDSDKLNIVCTTGMIGDALTHIAGDAAQVTALMGPGVDPHLYKPTQGDLGLLSQADVIVYNGLHLEGKMGEVLKKLSRTKKVIAMGELLPPELLRHPEGDPEAHDPHIWFDVSLWARAVRAVGEQLAQTDSSNAAIFRSHTASYAAQLDSLHQRVQQQIASIPADQRVLVTAHDAFGYFGRAYQLEVHGLQGISTASEYGLRDVSDMVNFLTERKIKAVFVETSVPAKSLEAVLEGCSRRGHQIRIGGHLYSDAMGEKGSPEGTYIGMVEANVAAMVGGLR